jgi:hypothetical protein
MPLTDQDIRALVHLAVACRPSGAPRWDEAGIFSSIAKVRTLAIDDVALATIRAAADANAKTPGVIANIHAPNWSERAPNRPQPREPWDANDFCEHTQKPLDRCQCGGCVTAAAWRAHVAAESPKPKLPRVKEQTA